MRRVDMIPKHLDGIGFMSTKAGSYSGTPQSTVQYYTKQGFVKPEIQDTTGKGVRRLYSALNVIEIGIIRSLTHNVPEETIKVVMSFLKDHSPVRAREIEVAGFEKELTKLESLLNDNVSGYLKEPDKLKKIINKIEKLKHNSVNEDLPCNLERLLGVGRRGTVVAGYIDIFFTGHFIDDFSLLGRIEDNHIDPDTDKIMGGTVEFIGGDANTNDRFLAESDRILTINLTRIAKNIIEKIE